MRIDRRAALLALATLVLATASPAASGDAAPAAPIRAVEAALAGRDGAAPSEAAVRAAVARSFNLDAMARAVLGGQAFTPKQFGRFREALADHLVLDMLGQRRDGRRGTIMIVRTRAIGTGEWVVDTRVETPGRPHRSVSWRVSAGSGRALITDLLGNGASLVRSWRNRHLPTLRRVGLDGLIERLEARNRRMRG
ncbi:MAG TPA: ABC transporter substrate-binding protein [Allosphingosinicella sp.]|nr:ABC transporter substrate-binding protein [Allosphingosinicella sp.]